MLATNEIFRQEALPDNVGRFKPLRILGKGAQGIVYLASDPQLDRQVALKTLPHRSSANEQLINEAKNVSQLQHANIVPLYEIGTHEDRPYLVYPFVDGQTLRNILNDKKIIPVLQSVKIISQVLDALSYAHNKNIIHRDLKPDNIMIDRSGTPRVMDFGISTFMGGETGSNEIQGTVKYMSPEQLNNKPVGPYSDIFSLGVVLFEMLTGICIFSANNDMASIFKIINEDILPPSRCNEMVDENLDRIVLTALSKDIDSRYADAERMKEDIELYLVQEAGEITDTNLQVCQTDSIEMETLAILRRNMERKKDFPAIAQNVSSIMQHTANGSSAEVLARIILRDQALCSKLLKLANSSCYGHFGGEIRTISRAIVLLGMEHVRTIAVGIIMFQHIQNAVQAEALKSNCVNSFLSALLARSLAGFIDALEPEEAFLASMFNKFGKQMTIYYLPDEYQEINDLVTHKGMKEDNAASRILGMSYVKLGRFIAGEWGLPENILTGLQPVSSGIIPKPKNRDELLSQLAAFTNEIADVAGSNIDNKQVALEKISNRYKRSFELDTDKAIKLIKLFVNEIIEYAKTLDIEAANTRYFKNLMEFIAPDRELTDGDRTATPEASAADKGIFKEHVLTKGIAEITNMIFADEELKMILPAILKTIYAGLGCKRVILLLKEKINHTMQARAGFGDRVNEIIPDFNFRVKPEEDIFNKAANNGTDIIIPDTRDGKFKNNIPEWCRDLTAPGNLILLPVMIGESCIGIIYIENLKAQIPDEIMNYVDTLRKQVAMTIRQKSKN